MLSTLFFVTVSVDLRHGELWDKHRGEARTDMGQVQNNGAGTNLAKHRITEETFSKQSKIKKRHFPL